MSEEQQQKLIGKMSSHNTAQLKQFFDGSEIEGDWQLIYAASYNGCIISLPAKDGGHMRLRVAARYQHEFPYLELRTDHMKGSKQGAENEETNESETVDESEADEGE